MTLQKNFFEREMHDSAKYFISPTVLISLQRFDLDNYDEHQKRWTSSKETEGKKLEEQLTGAPSMARARQSPEVQRHKQLQNTAA